MRKLSPWILVSILILGVVFLAMDNCGNTDKYNKLKGEYQTYYNLSRVVIKKSIEAIDEQDREIVALDEKLTYLHGIIEVKDEDLADKEEELGELKRDFADLKECQVQYDKLVAAFTLCKSIGVDKDDVIFSLNKKYESQALISIKWEEMYNSVQPLIDIHTKQVKELENINRRLKLTSKLKTGIVVAMAGVVLYSLLKD